jgi:hypothetical protein
MLDESLQGALMVIDALEELGISYYVGGSLASSTYGEHRSSLDADLIVDLRIEHVKPLVSRLQAEFYADDEMMRDAIARKSSFNLLHFHILSKVDVFIPKDRPYDRMQFERRILQQIHDETDREVYVASPEDTVLTKLEWYRLGHEVSDRQWRDIQGVLKARGNQMDHPYLRRWAAELHVADLLDRALEEAAE